MLRGALDLSGQRVQGPLEPLSGLTQLTSLVLAYSQSTSGTIPASFARLSQLTTLRLHCCGLGGKVPALNVFQRVPDYAQQFSFKLLDVLSTVVVCVFSNPWFAVILLPLFVVYWMTQARNSASK